MLFEELIAPLTKEQFFDEYKGKKIFIKKSKENKFKDHFTWKEFDEYLQSVDMNGYDRCPQLSIVYGKTRYSKKENKIKFKKEEIYKQWKDGMSFIIPISENLNKTMWNQCEEFEKYFGNGCANIYCSSKKNAKVFPTHADSTENFLFHVYGNVKWYIYNEFLKKDNHLDEFTLYDSFELNAGDLLYIPTKLYHNTEVLGPRITISYHFQEKQSKYQRMRNPWLNWIPRLNGVNYESTNTNETQKRNKGYRRRSNTQLCRKRFKNHSHFRRADLLSRNRK